MNKSFSGATDLFGMEIPTKRTNDRPEAAALCEVLLALRAHPAVVWCERMNSGAAKIGTRFSGLALLAVLTCWVSCVMVVYLAWKSKAPLAS